MLILQMKIITNTKQLISIINSKNLDLSFIPTMGGLHKGHLSLITKAKKKKLKTLVSIFVNPTQFNNSNDFKSYPRNINKDIIMQPEPVPISKIFACLLPCFASPSTISSVSGLGINVYLSTSKSKLQNSFLFMI